MFEKIVEIIVYLISELRKNQNINEIDVSELHKLGYTNAEISTAFSWLADRVEFTEELFFTDNLSQSYSFRILHDAESDMLTKDAWGELVQLHTLGLLTNEHVENIIERGLMASQGRIDKKQLHSIVAGILFDESEQHDRSNRLMLNSNDTVH
ncbi:MAG: DUF494 family protein [Candidatus Kapaibacterium sp.]